MTNQLFLEALGASLRGRHVAWDMELTQENWVALFKLAQAHQVLPMIFEAVYACPAAKRADPGMFLFFRRHTMQSVMVQAVKTGEFLSLMKHLRAQGLTPCVVKGIVCRDLYPNPDHRGSSDEDVLIPPQQEAQCHEAMLKWGMRLLEEQTDRETAYEVPYGKPGSPLCIELHKHLFPPEADAYGDWNRFFESVHERTIETELAGGAVLTMSPTDHFFYLICHAFKHFLHSGFGLRQVCDIVLFAEHYAKEIDWAHALELCQEIRADQFAAALLRIGEKHFEFVWPQEAEAWKTLDVDEAPMLCDLLDSGIYGDASMSRKHSSTMTLHAVAADKRGKRARQSALRTLFPKAKDIEGRYPYLKKKPWLLPVAWACRIAGYLQRRGKENDSAAESLKIGAERVELLRRYGVIK